MIGRSGQDGHGPIQLFGQHGAGQGVRPGLGTKGQGRGRGLAHAFVQPVRPADGEDQTPFALITQPGDMVGEGARGIGLSPFVAGDQVCALGGGQDQFGLWRLARLLGGVGVQQAKMQMSAEQAAVQSAMMGSIMPVALLAGMVFGIVLSLALAWAQWKYMTRAIPIIILAMFAYSLLTGLIAAATGQYNGLGSGYPILMGVSWAVQIVSAVLYVASLRGAFVLHRLQQEP